MQTPPPPCGTTIAQKEAVAPGLGAGVFGAGDTGAVGEGLGAVGALSPEEHPRSASVVRIANANLKTASHSPDGAASITAVIRTHRRAGKLQPGRSS